MRQSRLLSILLLLQLRRRLTAEALAQEFEVSVRTIYRDVDQLSAAGIPVFADRGPGGGFQLLDGYQTRLTGLATDEAEALLMVGLPGPAAALGLGPASTRAAHKLRAALAPGLGDMAGRMGERFHLDAVDWYRAAEPLPQLPALARAVLDQRLLAMRYQSWKQERRWQVQPLGLVMKAGSWYLVAGTPKGARIFKVSQILEHTVQAESFERPAGFDLPAHWGAELARFEAQLRHGSALLRASSTGLARLTQLGAYAAEAVKAAKPADAEGWRQLELPIENIDQAALALLGIGPELEVLQPPALREALCVLAGQVARQHAKPAT